MKLYKVGQSNQNSPVSHSAQQIDANIILVMNKQVFVAFLVLAVATVCIRAECEDSSDDGAIIGFLKKVGCNTKEGAEKVGNVVVDGAKATKEGAVSIGSSIVDGVKDGAEYTKDGVLKVGGKIVDGVKDGAEATKDGAQNLGGKIADGAVSAKDSVLEVGSDIKNKASDLVG